MSGPTRAAWTFGYAPVNPAAGPPEPARELVVATVAAVDPAAIEAAAGPAAHADTLLARPPLFWTRLRLEQPELPAAVAAALRAAGLAVRYVASAERPSLALAPALDLRGVPVATPAGWPALRRAPEAEGAERAGDGSWFVRGGGGVAVDRARSRGGAGARLAVIDDDARDVAELDLDAEVLVTLALSPRNQAHGPLMIAWAARARRFAGVAPRASARLYLIPKPGTGVVALPLAIARAALDGADVITCATYVEGSTSPMLDDALEVAVRLGRRGRGAAVVMPTGREASSALGSVHASFSLGLGEPASDPRVFCVAPGARGGGWFLWKDRRGRLRPFANRGPAVRWTAPGDDVAYPFAREGAPGRLCHAESSGASAIASGVLLLVLAENPTLRRAELAAVVDATLSRARRHVAGAPLPAPLADPADVQPAGRDRDGHDAKLGFGLLHAGRACLAAADPVCGALLAMGCGAAARAWADARGIGRKGRRRARRRDPAVMGAYSRALARWAVRALLADREAALVLRVILSHLRLVGDHEARLLSHGAGALTRQLALLLRRLADARVPSPRAVRDEVRSLAHQVEGAVDGSTVDGPTMDGLAIDGSALLERAIAAVASRCFAQVD